MNSKKKKYQYQQTDNKQTNKPTTALTSAALQQHLLKSLSLSLSTNLTSQASNQTHRLKPKSIKTRKNDQSNRKNKTNKEINTYTNLKEYVVDSHEEPLTLAQTLGIVPRPDPKLTEVEWNKLKSASTSRNDSMQPCVICKDDFGLKKQVLLSCGHVFHQRCLEAFETFSGKNCCPMCRKEKYEKRIIYEGAQIHVHKCAVRIQSAWRGYIVHRWYKKFRSVTPPTDIQLRKTFFEEKLSELTNSLARSVNTDADEINELFKEIDNNMNQSRQVMKKVGNDCFVFNNGVDWCTIMAKAKEDYYEDCPICYSILKSVDNHGILLRCLLVLSCGHIFHKECLESFENFTLSKIKLCPYCRSKYDKKIINDI